jgi:hypothetical protein
MDEQIVKAVYRQIMFLGPIYFSQFILICLIVYRLTKNNLSQEEKKNISYAELAISFIASFVLIVVYGVFLFFVIFSFRFIDIYTCLLFLLYTPFTFTVLRVALDNKLNEEQKHVLSVLTIPLIVYAALSTTILATRP